MIKIFNKPLLLLVLVVIVAGLIFSCKKNDNSVSGMVELLSFGPTGARHGDTLRFIGKNLDKVTGIDLTGATVDKAAFVEQTTELIKILIPVQTQQGFVTLKTPEGNIISKTKLNLEVAVTVTSMTPQSRPGDNITIKGNYLNWITQVWFAKNIMVDSFVSKSLTELVVKVPVNAQSGPITFNTGGTKPLEIISSADLAVTLPAITGISPIPVEREKNITITGTNLDLTKGILFKGKTQPDTVFVSKSATQLVIKVPKEANKGKITLVAYSSLTVESSQSLSFVGDLPDLAPLKYAFYIDALQNPWQNWGWGSTIDFANTENVRDGAASIKVDYTGQWSALKFANGSVSTSPYSELAFSLFGTPGTAGKKLNLTPNSGKTYTITIEEGKWIEYKLSKDDIGNPATITDLTFQNQDWIGKIYVDHVGFR